MTMNDDLEASRTTAHPPHGYKQLIEPSPDNAHANANVDDQAITAIGIPTADLLLQARGDSDASAEEVLTSVIYELYLSGDVDGALSIASLLASASGQPPRIFPPNSSVEGLATTRPPPILLSPEPIDPFPSDAPMSAHDMGGGSAALRSAAAMDDIDQQIDERDFEMILDRQMIPVLRWWCAEATTLDWQSTKLVGLIDGSRTLDEILRAFTMTMMIAEAEALQLFTSLVERGVVGLR